MSVGLCRIRGVPPREWSLSVPDWSLAHKGDAAFERSRQEALQTAPDAVARKREELDRTPRAIMEEALKRAQGKKRRRIPTIRTLHADYVADTERLLAKKRAAGKSVGELVLKRRNLKRFCEWWFAHRRWLANKSIIEVSRGGARDLRRGQGDRGRRAEDRHLGRGDAPLPGTRGRGRGRVPPG